MNVAARLRLATREGGASAWVAAAVAWIAVWVAGAAHAFGPASDYASAAAYDDGWTDGDDGGTGFDYPWTFMPALGAPFGVESSTLNGDGDSNGDGDIDTNGRSFVMRAVGTNVYAALRFLTPEPLAVGDRVSWDFDATGFGVDGFASCDLTSQTNVRFDLRVAGGEPNYSIYDADGSRDSGVAVGDEGLHVDLDLTGANSYTLRLTPLGGTTSVRSGTLNGAGDIELFRCGIGNDASGANVAYFNSIVIPEPGGAAGWVAVAALGVLRSAASRRRSG